MKPLLKTAALKDDVELQPHQQEAVDHADGKAGTILSHGLGSGKTLTGIAIGEQQGGNTLAVTPASLQDNYDQEVEKFVQPDRHEAHKSVSYSKFRRDPQTHVDEHEPDTMILDEMHRLRNPTQAREAVEQVRPQVDKVVGQTASLTNNHPREVAPLTNIAAGEKVIGEQEFDERFVDQSTEKTGIIGKIMGAQDGEEESITNQEELRERLSPHIHHYEPDKSGPNYPDTETEEVDVEMSDKQREMLKALEKKNPGLAYKMKHNLPPSKQESSKLNSFLQASRQISNTPAGYDKTIDDPMEDAPKMQRVRDDMEDSERGVVYSNYLGSGAQPVTDEIDDAELYHGSLSQKQRQELLDDYESGDKRVLGLSPAGAEGIDLKGVQDMAVMDPDWNPETTNQAIGRTVRYESHSDLPEDKQQVNVRKYRSVYPDRLHHKLPGIDKPQAPDEYMSEIQQDKQRLNDEFYEALAKKEEE